MNSNIIVVVVVIIKHF